MSNHPMLIVKNKYESLYRILNEAAYYSSRDEVKELLGDLIIDLNDGRPSRNGIHFFLKPGSNSIVNTNDLSYLTSELQQYLNENKYKVKYYLNYKDTEGSSTPKNPIEGIMKISKGKRDYILKYHVSGKDIYKGSSDKSDKSDTRDLTALKEYTTILAIKNKYTSIDDLEDFKDDFNKYIKNTQYSKYKESKLITSYLISAIKASKCFYNNKSRFNPKNYSFERQGEGISSKIYNVAKRLTGISKSDNWNPADIWIFKNSFVGKLDKELAKCNTADDLNSLMLKEIKQSNIIPISLKLIDSKSEPRFSFIDSNYISNNFNLKDVYISKVKFDNRDGTDIPNSFNLILKNGYNIHGHAKASKTTDICSYELQPGKGSKVQCGAIDKASVINKYIPGIQSEQRESYTKSGNKIYNQYIKPILSSGVQTNLGSDIKRICNETMSDSTDLITKQRFVMSVVNVYFILNNMDDQTENDLTVIQKMFLSGLKTDFGSGQCPHYKIY